MCNYKRKRCVEPCHVTKSGKTVYLCLEHYRAYNASLKAKGRNVPKVSSDRRESQNALRVKAHSIHWQDVLAIQNMEVQKIASALLTFRNKRVLKSYIILQDVIRPTNLGRIKLKGLPEIISFDGVIASSTRSQQNISNGAAIIGNVLDAFKIIFPGCKTIAVKLLVSEPGDKEQQVHTDFNYNSINLRVRDLKDFHYSALVAIEHGSHLLVGVNKERVDIPINGMIFWRGDCFHAGGGYSSINRRIFISISSFLCPVSDTVYLHPDIKSTSPPTASLLPSLEL